MHVAVVGAGALGRLFGVHLATAGERVSFVVRPSRLGRTEPFALLRLNGDRRYRELPEPELVTSVPVDASAIVLAVRAEQIDEALAQVLQSSPPVPVISLTPLLDESLERLERLVGGRTVVAMPAVAGLLESGVVRYVAFRLLPTLVEQRPEHALVLDALTHALLRSGLAARLSEDVRRRNPATTVAFFPLTLALAAAGSAAALARHSDLKELAARACRETLALGRRVGPVEPAAALAARFVTPARLTFALELVRRLAPRAVRFAERHYGDKLVEQNEAMGREILAMGRRHGVSLTAFEELLDACRLDVGSPRKHEERASMI